MSLPFLFTEPIRTKRLTLRLMVPSDLDDVVAYQGREDVARYLLHEPRDRVVLEPKIAEWGAATRMAEDGDYLQLAIQLEGQLDGHPPQRVIGHMYLNLASVENLGAEIGWTLHPDFFGHGYATEAAVATLQLAFGDLGMHRVRAELDPRNDASIALCLRLGMREEALFVKDLMFKGDWADTGVYAILDEEWAARHR
ncbi:MAG: GNAT family protein [Pseudolysinimonas sp.]